MSRNQGGNRAPPRGKNNDIADGDLSNVNPLLLERSKDANSWREERRKALLSKVFHRNAAAGAPNAPATLSSAQYMPLAQEKDDEEEDTAAQSTSTSQRNYSSADGMKRCRASDQQYILERFSANKTRKVETPSAPVAKLPESTPSPATLPAPAAATKPTSAAPAPKPALLKPPEPAPPVVPEATGQLSLKERILQKYKKTN